MFKLFLVFLFFVNALFAEVYYAKVEPYKFHNVASDVTGIVTKVNDDLLGKVLHNEVYISIDDLLDKEEYNYTKQKIKDLQSTLDFAKKTVANLQEVLKRKRINYKKIEAMKIKSRIEKDREFYDLIATQNNYLATQKEINTLQMQIADLLLRKKSLYKTLHDKRLRAKGLLLYSIQVKEGQFVNKGTPLATLADTSKALLTIYVNENDIDTIQNKVVYIDGKKTKYKVNRFVKVADNVNLSKYEAQIIIKAPKIFSQLVKVELKGE